MFTGIVEERGVIAAVEPRPDAARLLIRAARVLEDVREGASIAVNGVCLTVTGWSSHSDGQVFAADVMRETLDRSALGRLSAGDPVNLERAVRLADRIGGHLVQGHVDGVGVVLHRQPGPAAPTADTPVTDTPAGAWDGNDRYADQNRHAVAWEVVRISLPPGLDRYLVEKGSITVDGVSLTVVGVTAATGSAPASFTVSLIPTTLRMTTLGHRAVGEQVNLEVDILAKYVEKLTAARDTTGADHPGTLTSPVQPGNGHLS
jgi:riboflavin synthase